MQQRIGHRFSFGDFQIPEPSRERKQNKLRSRFVLHCVQKADRANRDRSGLGSRKEPAGAGEVPGQSTDCLLTIRLAFMVQSERLPRKLRKRRKRKGKASRQSPQALLSDLAGGKRSRDTGRSSGSCSWNGHSAQQLSRFVERPVLLLFHVSMYRGGTAKRWTSWKSRGSRSKWKKRRRCPRHLRQTG